MHALRRSLGPLLTLLSVLLLAGSAEAAIEIKVPGEKPDFRQGIHDYVLPDSVCADRFRLHVETPGETEARIGGGRKFSGSRTRYLRLQPSQAIRVTRYDGTASARYYFRCLPGDFPRFSFESYRRPEAGLFAVSPFRPDEPGPGYAIIFDRGGAPVWWQRPAVSPIDVKVLSNGLIAWASRFDVFFGSNRRTAYQLRRPDGTLVRKLRTVGTVTDHHDLQETADGNYLLLSYKRRDGVDTSEFTGDSTSASVLDAVVQKVTPRNELLWEWNSAEHVALSETGRWWEHLVEPYDIVHINSVDETANGDYLVSLRHTDAVYRLDGRTGNVEWKLGGTTTPASLTVVGDPRGAYPFGGQHDARELGNGDIAVHDNGLDQPPRAVRYRISGRTATLVDSQRDPRVSESNCCGSARVVGSGWLTSWGGQPLVTEFNGRGRRTFALEFGDSTFSYRAAPVQGGVTLSTLRLGMDARVPLKP